ncbi:hypothetical protein N665_0383s0006 [Sinapis alba]|nr:hypothetical protein N665_0383s0006 [Sinapis alba]
MNPMQGQQNTGGSSTELNQGDNGSVYSTESSLNTMINQVDNGLPVTSTPPGRPTYASPSFHAAQNHNWWRLGESSSVSGLSDQLGLNAMMVDGGVHAAGYIRNGPTFLRSSSSNAMSMDMDSDDYGAQQTSGLVFRHSNYGSSLESSVLATGESSSGPVSSLDGWGLSLYAASSSLSLATPSQTSTSHFGGGRVVATNAFHFVRNADTSSRPVRRLNLRQPLESVGFSISHSGGFMCHTGSLQQRLPLDSPFVDPQDVRSRSGENQTNLVHLPDLTRNISQFAWDTSSGIGMPAEGFRPQWETPRSNPEQPMFAPPTGDMRNSWPSSDIHAQQLSPSWIPPQRYDYMVFDPLIFQSMTEMHDKHQEMRLDELLALGERIGDVSTGLREDVILKTMKQHKCTSSSAELHQDIEPFCIFQCGHEFQKDCIKQWIMLKNRCPICKTVALMS